MSGRTWIAGWLGILVLSGCTTPPDNYIHREAGLKFPGQIGAFRLMSITTNSPVGPDVSVNYSLVGRAGGQLTIIVYPAPHGTLGMQLIVDDTGRPKISDKLGEVFQLTEPTAGYDQQFEASLQAILQYRSEMEMVSSETRIQSLKPPNPISREAVFRGPFAPIPDAVSRLLLFVHRDYFVKIRVTTPANAYIEHGLGDFFPDTISP